MTRELPFLHHLMLNVISGEEQMKQATSEVPDTAKGIYHDRSRRHYKDTGGHRAMPFKTRKKIIISED